MTHYRDDPQSLLPLSSTIFHILLTLVEEERHGYGIMQEAAHLSDGRVNLGPGTLYLIPQAFAL